MNRRQRREHDRRRRRFTRAVEEMLAASRADGRPWAIHGLVDACSDCGADASISGTPGSGVILADISHDPTCPAFNGLTPWTFVP